MGAIGLWLRAEGRARRKSALALALVLGLAGSLVIAAAAGARRTATVYDRMLMDARGAQLTVLDDGAVGVTVPLQKIIDLPQVSSSVRGSLVFYVLGDHAAMAAIDDALGRTTNTWKILDGRMYRSDRVEEVVIGFGIARRLRLHVGSTFPLVEPRFVEQAAEAGIENRTMRVVGVVSGPGEFPPQYAGLYPSIHMTPAFFRTYGNRLSAGDEGADHGSVFIDLRRGRADLKGFLAGIARVGPEQPVVPQSAAEIGAPAKRSFRFQATGLWLLAAFGLITLLLIAGQALARQTFIASDDYPVLRALGSDRRQLFLIGIARAAGVGTIAAAVAVVAAILLSPLAPAGDARIAEPHPGVAFDGVALAAGAGGLLVLSILVAVMPSLRMARLGGSVREAEAASVARPSRVAGALARARIAAPAVAGARLALESGRGRTAVPVRSTVAGAVFGLGVLVAALSFGASLNHLIDTPALYGVGWDAYLTHFGDGPDLRRQAAALTQADGISEITIAGDLPLDVAGRQVLAFGLEPLRGRAGPPILDGRAPRDPGEIALTARTLRRAKASIGSSITVRVPIGEAPPVTYRVVGRTVIPPFGFVTSDPGEGALMTLPGMERLIPPRLAKTFENFGFASDAFVRYVPGADRHAVVRSLAPLFGRAPDEFGEVARETPADIVSFGRVQNLPLLLGVVIGLIAAATLAHTVASSVRRRRADLAILKTIGFVRRQIVSTVAFQATVLIAAALAVGIPGGVALGRWAWLWYADQIGVVPRAEIATAATLLVVPAALVLANVIAALPGRAAARLRPAVILRTE